MHSPIVEHMRAYFDVRTSVISAGRHRVFGVDISLFGNNGGRLIQERTKFRHTNVTDARG